jgi:hypothetical protein
MFKYRLYLEDGTEAGEAKYAVTLKPGEIVWALGNRKLRVLDLASVEDEDSPYVGLLKVEAA